MTLGVAPDATDAQVCSAFRKAARSIHPDKNPQEIRKAEKAFHKLQQAYEKIRAAIASKAGHNGFCPESAVMSADETTYDPALVQIIHEELLEASDEHWPLRLRRLAKGHLVGLQHRLQGQNCLADSSSASGACSAQMSRKRMHHDNTPLQPAKVCWRRLHIWSRESPLTHQRKAELVEVLSAIKTHATQALSKGVKEEIAFREAMNSVRCVTPIAVQVSFETGFRRKKQVTRRHTPRTLDLETAHEHLRKLEELHASPSSRSKQAFDDQFQIKLQELKSALILRRRQRVHREHGLLRSVQSELWKRTKRLRVCGKQLPPPPYDYLKSSQAKRRRLMHKQSHPAKHVETADAQDDLNVGVSNVMAMLQQHFNRDYHDKVFKFTQHFNRDMALNGNDYEHSMRRLGS